MHTPAEHDDGGQASRVGHAARTRMRRRRHRVPPYAAVLALLGALLVPACSTQPGSGGGFDQQAFCDLWSSVQAQPPTSDSAVQVEPGVVALAQTTSMSGDTCTAPSSKIAFGDAVLAEGDTVPSERGDATSDPIAAVSGEEVSPSAPVLENVSIRSLSATIDRNGIGVRGTVGLRISGVESQIGFVGSLRDVRNWSVSLSSGALTIPGITTGPATFSGTLASTNGAISLVLTATVPSARIGDVTVTGTTLTLRASSAAGVEIAVAGSIAVGPAVASGTLYVQFDRAGGLVIARADIDLALSGIQADGSRIDLAGKLDVDGNAQETVATFSATGSIGSLNVEQASGTITMSPNQAVFDGFVDIGQGPNAVRFDGSIVWDGQVAYAPFLTVEAAGQYSGTLENGQNVSVHGITQTTIVDDQLVTTIRGDFELGTLRATGQAVVDANGDTTELTVDAQVADAGFDAHITGRVVMTDGVAQLVDLDAVLQGTATIGDLQLSVGHLAITTSKGHPLDITFEGAVRIGDTATLNGDAEVVFGPDGTMMSVIGDFGGEVHLGKWDMDDLRGTLQATPEQVTVTASGSLRLSTFPVGVGADVTLTSSLTRVDWQLVGDGHLILGPLDIAHARIRMGGDGDLYAVRMGAYVRLGLLDIYVEGDLHLLPSGGCDHLQLTNGGPVVKSIIRNRLPDVLGCPVNG
jgi:hypothetical protein